MEQVICSWVKDWTGTKCGRTENLISRGYQSFCPEHNKFVEHDPVPPPPVDREWFALQSQGQWEYIVYHPEGGIPGGLVSHDGDYVFTLPAAQWVAANKKLVATLCITKLVACNDCG